MHAVLVEVNADESHVEAAREFLTKVAAPGARDLGAKGGYWLTPQGGRGVSVVAFETEEQARKVAANFKVGDAPMPGTPPGVTVRSVEVREVLASV